MKSKIFILLCVVASLCFALCGCVSGEVREVVDGINSLGEITVESEVAISSLEEKYDALNNEDKPKIDNIDELEEARAKVDELIKEADCLAAIAGGIQERSRISANPVSTFAEMGASLSEGVSAEIDAISGIDSASFGNESFANALKQYRKALESEAEGLVDFPNDKDLYNGKYISGEDVRSACLDTFRNDFGLTADFDTRTNMIVPTAKMVAPGEPQMISTDNGDVEIAIEGMAQETFNYSTGDKTVTYLLCKVHNVSRPTSEEYSEWIRFDELGTVVGIDGVSLSPVDGSYSFEGYVSGGAGAFGCYTNSVVPIGETKRISIPYEIVGDATGGFLVQLKNDSFLVVS